MFFICQLPIIAKGIGKNQFKRYLELFIDTIFYSLVRFISSFIFLLLFYYYFIAGLPVWPSFFFSWFSVVGAEKRPPGGGKTQGSGTEKRCNCILCKTGSF